VLARDWGKSEEFAEFASFPGRGARYRVRLSVRGRVGALRIGIFEKGSHSLVHIPDCPVHHESIATLLPAIVRIANEQRVLPYHEETHQGVLRAVQLAVEPETGTVQVVFILKDDLRESIPRGQALAQFLSLVGSLPLVHSVFLGALPHKTNTLAADRYVSVLGPSSFEERCGGVRVFYPPGAFGQANPVLHGRVVERVHAMVPGGAQVVEYYAGVGTIGLGLAARGASIKFNELGVGSLEGLSQGLLALGRPSTATVHEGKAGECAGLYQWGDTVIVDPPRKGLDEALLRRLLEEPPERLIYLSCGIEALERESALLRRSDRYELAHLSGWSYFPFTEHVETLFVLRRKEP
jgi:23S rRNA (uracil1939-C5)-methyltransferase